MSAIVTVENAATTFVVEREYKVEGQGGEETEKVKMEKEVDFRSFLLKRKKVRR